MHLQDLYQEVIIDHNNNPRNFREMSNPTCHAQGFNPLCGDKIKVFIKLNNNIIEDICFTGSGCAISQASASLMSESLKGKNLDEVQSWFENFHDMLTVESENKSYQVLGKLEALAGVKEFPARVKCATLAWHALENALRQLK